MNSSKNKTSRAHQNELPAIPLSNVIGYPNTEHKTAETNQCKQAHQNQSLESLDIAIVLHKKSTSPAPTPSLMIVYIKLETEEERRGRWSPIYVRVIVALSDKDHEGGVMGCLTPLIPLGPSIEGMGFRLAFAIGIRGTP